MIHNTTVAPRLSIIIVSYNTRELTLACLQSVLRETSSVSYELLVVDNASTDGSAEAIRTAFPPERYPQIRLFSLTENLGFAAANNLAARDARGHYILLLNPDTVVLDRALEKLAAFADAEPQWGVYGGSTVFADGTLNPTAGWMKPTVWSMFSIALGLARLFRRSRIFNWESLQGWSWDAPRRVDIVTGCLLMMRREDWQRLGGFDEQYFMYGEDADLCLRAAEAGLPAVLYPEARIVHHGGASEPVRSDKLVRLFRAKTQLFRAHYGPLRAAALAAMLQLWCLVRIVGSAVTGGADRAGTGRTSEWGDLWRRRGEWVGQSREGIEVG